MAAIKASRIPIVLGMCATDDRVADMVNESQERILSRGNWVGTQARYVFSTTKGTITWPRHVLVPNGVSRCDFPITIRNEWYEFLEHGPGLQADECGYNQLYDRGIVCCFADPDVEEAGDKKIVVYADVAEAVGASIILQGEDENGNRIRTLDGTEYIDGERIPLAVSPGTLSTKKFTKLTAAIKPMTNGFVRLYEYNTTLAANSKALAVYEPTETLPSYRRSVIGGFGTDPQASEEITAWVNLQHIPVRRDHTVNDNDMLVICNIPALKEMCLAVKYREEHDYARAEACERHCRAELEGQLLRYQGEGVVVAIRAQAGFGAGGVENPVGSFYG